MGSPVSFASCSRTCLVGFGFCSKQFFKISSCLAFMVVLGPRRFPSLPISPSYSFSLLDSPSSSELFTFISGVLASRLTVSSSLTVVLLVSRSKYWFVSSETSDPLELLVCLI